MEHDRQDTQRGFVQIDGIAYAFAEKLFYAFAIYAIILFDGQLLIRVYAASINCLNASVRSKAEVSRLQPDFNSDSR